MFPNRNLSYVPVSGPTDPSMSRRPVIPLSSFLFPLGSIRPSTAPSFSHPPVVRHLYTPPRPPYYPWFTAAAPFPLYFPPPHIPTRFLQPPALLGPRLRTIFSTNGLKMEQPETEREPPQKRRKSSEERAEGGKKHSEKSEGRTNIQYDGSLRENSNLGKQLNQEWSRERTKYPADDRQRRTERSGTAEETVKVDGSNPWMTADRPVQFLHRQWEPLSGSEHPPPPGVSAGFDFTVMSYNILSQDLLLDNAYLYRHCDPEVLPWEYRLPRLLREIQEHDADILCLQEVQQNHFGDQIRPSLEALGYQCEYKKRTGHKSDGCAVAFKTSRLSLLSSNHVEFFRRGDPLLDRDNVGLVVQLSPASDPASCVCVANTHLLYNPRRGDIKLAQLAILLAEVNRVSRLPDGSTNPVLLCGDFNSTPISPLYRFLTSGRLDYKGLAIGMVSGQEQFSRAQRLLCCPLWSNDLGISSSCQYQELNQRLNQDQTQSCQTQRDVQEEPGGAACLSPTVEGAISDLTVKDDAPKPAQEAFKRWKLSHSLTLKSSYNHRLNPDGREEITTCHSRTAMTVDYILYTPDSPVGTSPPPSSSLPGGRGLQLLGRLSLVGRPELEQVNGLPNENHSSDHLPLLARFRLPRR